MCVCVSNLLPFLARCALVERVGWAFQGVNSFLQLRSQRRYYSESTLAIAHNCLLPAENSRCKVLYINQYIF